MEEDHTRIFVASSELFSDFQVSISLYDVSTLDDIINQFKNELLNVLETNHFTNLIKKAKENIFHIHSKTIEDILTSESDEIFYICDHC